ncbi:MAG: zinc metalloprotease HtpX [Actinomycetaceae bacterium]|nr:zinc metalloprotease HtpX [Actinomycetaceae bacterium]
MKSQVFTRYTMHSNTVKTAVLFTALTGLVVAIGATLSYGTGSNLWLILSIAMALGTNAYAYWFSDKLALASMRAVEVSQQEAPQLHAMVAELAQRAGQPMPRLYIAPTSTPNAFATGRNPNHAAVCCTQGILDILQPRELRAVLGHELMHVYNRDILTSSAAAAIASVITSLAQGAMFFGMRPSSDDNGRGGNPILMLLLIFLAPLASAVLQMGISRTREFEADHDGALLAEDPLALASALRRLEQGNTLQPLEPTPSRYNVSALMIANPFRGQQLARMFSTHPPMEERIARLEKLAGY